MTTTASAVVVALIGAAAAVLVASPSPPASGGIPLCEGLTIVTAIEDPKGDYESVKRITRTTPEQVEIIVNGERPIPTGTRRIRVTRRVARRDLAAATVYQPTFESRAPAEIPGSTALGTSAAVLKALRATGAADLALVEPAFAAAPAADMLRNLRPYRLSRTGTGAVSVTVNGAKVDLPAVLVEGRALGERAQFAFLDDERNPLALRYAFTGGRSDESARLQVVRIAYDCSETPPTAPVSGSRLERALRDQGRADVYEIYFEFNSDRLRDESESTLREIAEILRRNGTWALGIEGHTDSIAGDAYNLDLSLRRAEAVKAALTTRYGVAASRLTTAGLGESRPKDRNDTLDGRARNRRVELVRRP